MSGIGGEGTVEVWLNAPEVKAYYIIVESFRVLQNLVVSFEFS